MGKFSLKLSAVYLIFLFAIFFISSEGKMEKKNKEKDIWKRPEYTIVVPRSASEVLMEREGHYVYSGRELDMSSLSGGEKKKVFIKLLLPAIEVVEREVKWKISMVEILSEKKELNAEEKEYLDKLFDEYKVDDRMIESLLSKMIMPPKSLVVSQAALESGWGSSRFFKEGNNIFGVWSYNKGEPRIAAKESRSGGFTAYLKSYPDLKGSIDDYVTLLSKSNNYKEFREGLKRGENSMELAEHLVRYSELREEYVKRVQSVIKSNELNKLD